MKQMKWKLYSILFLTVLGLYISVPSFIKQDKIPYWLTKVLPDNRIRLGLDLQGGLSLVMGVQVEKVVQENVDRYVERIKKEFGEKAVAFDSVNRRTDKSEFVVKYTNPADEDKVRVVIGEFGGVIKFVGNVSANELVYDLTDEHKDNIKKRALDQTMEAIRNRIDEFGVNEPSIQIQGNDRILIQLPGTKDPARAKSIIGRTAKLEFKIVLQDENFNMDKVVALVADAKAVGIDYTDGKTISYSDYVDKLNLFAEGKIPQNAIVLFEKKENEETGKTTLLPYLLEKVTTVTGDHLQDAYVNFDNMTNEPNVGFELTPVGTRFFEELTGKNVGKQLAIVLDKNVYSAPNIQEKISGQGRITLGRSASLTQMQEEAQDIALVLRAGALPAQLTFEEERTVGPTLGSDSIKQGSTAMILGCILIFVFMLVYYRRSGLVANIALAINCLLIFATLILFGATLTLPGIAGIALTIGMAVDANIIIYERIREEIRLGNGPKPALEIGFEKALSTIIDANLTTAISGIVLLQYGTGPIKGFAVTLLIGIVFTILTGVYFSKWLMKLLVLKSDTKSLSI